MMPRLLHPDRNADLERRPSPSAEDAAQDLAQDLPQELAEDLELPRVVAAMAAGEPRVGDVCRALLLSPLQDPAEIRYRQAVLRDCLARPGRRRGFGRRDGAGAGRGAGRVRRLPADRGVESEPRRQGDEGVPAGAAPAADRGRSRAGGLHLRGVPVVFRTLAVELDDEFFAAAEDHLRRLGPDGAVLLSARLGQGNRGTDRRLRMPDRPHGRARHASGWATGGGWCTACRKGTRALRWPCPT